MSRWLTVVSFTFLVLLMLGGPVWAVPTPPFLECPSIGGSPSCAILYQFLPGGVIASFGNPAINPYDGFDDSLVGVVNNSGSTQTSLTLSGVGLGGQPIFALDGDGICSFAPFNGSSYCNSLSGGSYLGPSTSFSGISADKKTGTINFLGGLLDGGTAFFSLEDQLDPHAPPLAGTPEPTTLVVFGTLLAGLGAAVRRRTRAPGQDTA